MLWCVCVMCVCVCVCELCVCVCVCVCACVLCVCVGRRGYVFSMYVSVFVCMYFSILSECVWLCVDHQTGGRGTSYSDHAWYFTVSEPGIRRGNKDSRGNENQKSWKKIFSAEKQIDKHFFFFKQPVAVAESMEIATLVPSKIDRGPLMELSFVEICIFQAISVTEVYGWS